jgi:hypothetical protein
MPTAYEAGPALSMIWVDLATLALTVGVCGWVALRAMMRAEWFPVGDPRLPEAMVDEHHAEHGQHAAEIQHG